MADAALHCGVGQRGLLGITLSTLASLHPVDPGWRAAVEVAPGIHARVLGMTLNCSPQLWVVSAGNCKEQSDPD